MSKLLTSTFFQKVIRQKEKNKLNKNVGVETSEAVVVGCVDSIFVEATNKVLLYLMDHFN